MMADRIGYEPTFHGKDLRILAETAHIHHALLAIDTREGSVRCESDRDRFLHFVIMRHAFGTRFLVTSQKHADPLVQRDIHFLYQFQRIQRGDGASFVVRNAASIKYIVLAGECIWIGVPAVAFRHHVQMRHQADDIFAFTDLRVTTVVVKVFRFKTHAIRDAERLRQSSCRTFSKWLTRKRIAPFGRMLHEVAKVFDHVFCQLFNSFFDFHDVVLLYDWRDAPFISDERLPVRSVIIISHKRVRSDRIPFQCRRSLRMPYTATY